MRYGSSDAVVLRNKKGKIVAFSTGSDHCAEHEQGSQDMQELFCENFMAADALARKLQSEDPGYFEAYFLGQPCPELPSVLERKRISKNLPRIQFEKFEHAGTPFAILAFNASVGYARSELESRIFSSPGPKGKPREIWGAWDSEQFAVGVKGDKDVGDLEEFYNEALLGRCYFAGTFLESNLNPAGVIVCRSEYLDRSEVKASLERTQEKFELSVLLAIASREEELRAYRRSSSYAEEFCHIWPVWKSLPKKGQGTLPELRYAVNPSQTLAKILPYYGPYEFEKLKALFSA